MVIGSGLLVVRLLGWWSAVTRLPRSGCGWFPAVVGWLKGEEQKTDTVVAAAGKLCVATMNGDGGANEGSRTHTRRR